MVAALEMVPAGPGGPPPDDWRGEMSFLVARSGPDFALVAADSRHMISRNGVQEVPCDLGGKMYPMRRGWGVWSAKAEATRIGRLQAAALTDRGDAANPASIRETLASVWERERGDGTDGDGLAGHFLAGTDGDVFGVRSFHLDGRLHHPSAGGGVGMSLSYGMADLAPEGREELLETLAEGSGLNDALDAAVRTIHAASEVAYDVSPEAVVGGVYAGESGVEYDFRKERK
jgi:hypothetical protein